MSLVEEIEKLRNLHQGGALTNDEFERAKRVLLESGEAPALQRNDAATGALLHEVKKQNALDRIDTDWNLEREQYLITSRYGPGRIPQLGDALGAVFGGLFGIVWTIMAFTMTNMAPDVGPFAIAKVIFPGFGVVITIVSFIHAARCSQKAANYSAAFERYKMRRDQATRAEKS